MFLVLILLAALLRPSDDEDGDGYTNVREAVHGCDPLARESFPTCQHGGVVACSLAEPGFTPPPEPC